MATFVETYDYHYRGHPGSFPTAASAPAANANPERHVLAERYKTKMCRNYLTSGECPYEVRCMFAHGEHELRTCEMNLHDGLVTEDAIKAFQRSFHMRNRAAQAQVPLSVPEYVGAPPMNLGPNRFAHNPYGYTVRSPSEERCSTPVFVPKVDPMAVMEP